MTIKVVEINKFLFIDFLKCPKSNPVINNAATSSLNKSVPNKITGININKDLSSLCEIKEIMENIINISLIK